MTVMVVSHDPAVAERADRVVHLVDGGHVGREPADPDRDETAERKLSSG